MSAYKIIVRGSPGWRNHKAATFGVSVSSPNWQGDKFASILDWAATKFETIRIDVTDALYRHNFMAEGATPQEAEARAQALGTLWLARHQDMIDACPVTPQIIRWGAWYRHPDYRETLAGFEHAYTNKLLLREAVQNDVTHFHRRQHPEPSQAERIHSTHYLIEERAVRSLQGRALASAKIYPGDELHCMQVVRRGLIPEAPKGLEREQFAKIKLQARGLQAEAEPQVPQAGRQLLKEAPASATCG